ncbi:MAG: hypothetical protein R3B13_29795 [Polyangiaceae bacterium]
MRQVLPVTVLLLAVGCKGKPSDPNANADSSAPPGPSASASAAAVGSSRPPRNAPLAEERIDIPAGAFTAGTVPGEPGRLPELEPMASTVELGEFKMDRLPYPNDPTQPPLLGLSREEARKKCAQRGGRLCTELEWERACRGPAGDAYPTGAAWDARCAEEPRTCATGFEVLGMGAAHREWTHSDVVPEEGPRRASVRGAGKSDASTEHRCAARRGIDPETKSDDTAFRCCAGAPNAAVVKEPRLGPTFRKIRLTAKELEDILRTDPKTASLAKDIQFFHEPEAANTVVERGPGDKKGFLFTVSPLLWNPVAGSEFLLVAARSGKTVSFVVALHVLGEKRYALSASYVMLDEPGPVALAYSGYIRPRLHFSTCWGCPGETGKILHRDPDAVSIVQP